MQTLVRDLRHGLRLLAKSPAFTIVSVLTVALGIGANTAMFSVVNAVLLRPLPFRDPQRLLAVGEFDTRRGPTVHQGRLSYPDLMDVRTRNHSFEAVAGYNSDMPLTLTGAGQALHVKVATVTSNLFQLLGAQPSLGRSFIEHEDDPGHHVAVLSDVLWRRQFHADPGVVGTAVSLNGRVYTIVGVMPGGFQFPVEAEAADLWITFSRDSEVDHPEDPTDVSATAQRGSHYLSGIARLNPGVTLEHANADLGAIAHRLATEYPNQNSYSGLAASRELDDLVGDNREPLLVLFGAVGLVLLIACANLANLLLARGTNRAHEIAIRGALGASRGQIVRQLLVEALALSLTGAALGTAVATGALSAILKLYPSNLPRAAEIGIDYRVLLFTAALAVVTGVVFGIVPALEVSSPNLTEVMRERTRSTTLGRSPHRWRAALVIVETALGMILLIGAGLLLRSFDRLSRVNLGLNPEHVLTANFDLSETRYSPEQQDRFIQELLHRIRALPGVIHAAGSFPLPLSAGEISISFNLLDHPVSEANEPDAHVFVVVPGWFETLEIPLLRGRTFDERDQRNAAPVMIINQEFARKFFPHEDPIGRRVKVGATETGRESYGNRQVVGVVGNTRRSNLAGSPEAALYIPLSQLMWGAPTLVVRTPGDPHAIAPQIRKVLTSMDPDAPLYDVRTLEDYLVLDLGRARFQAVLLGLFAGLALLLTAVGLYGVMTYTVAQRTQEMGIRLALGARREDVLRMILAKSLFITGVGLLIGIAGAFALTRLLSSLLFEVKSADPMTFAVVALLLVGTSTLASYLPARRAAGVEPMMALRDE